MCQFLISTDLAKTDDFKYLPIEFILATFLIDGAKHGSVVHPSEETDSCG